MAIETKHHEPIVYDLYKYLSEYCVGEDNAMPARDLAARFDITERALRDYISIIRTSDELRKVIGSSPKGYYVCKDKKEAERANQTFWAAAFSYLKVARAQEIKAGLDGQYLIALGDSYKQFYKAFGE
ncbi:MAG: hypothetical protein J1E81_10300 [Eubacterium sp.]|nr:hypothetical protein [Eubacterium sp.]